MHRFFVLCPYIVVCLACSAGGSASTTSYGGAGGAPSKPDSGIPTAGSGGFGGSGAGGVAGSGGITPAPDAARPYDPDAGFDWPEAVDAGKCQAGTYSGTYECTIDFNGVGFVIDGQVSFTLSPSQNGEFLEIKDGKLNADVEMQLTLTGDLIGKLDCQTNKFVATIQNGTYTFLFFGVPIGNPFGGDLAGVLDRLTSTMNGEWSLASSQAFIPGAAPPGCSGPWRVTLQP